jgi:hypothetical protein
MIVVVVDLAAAGGLTASGKAAVHVAEAHEATHRRSRTVTVDPEDHARDRVGEQALPPRCFGEEVARRIGVDGGAPVEHRAALARACMAFSA